jgi:hypothetical protein
MAKARFEAELVEGHKGVIVVLVPFDPEKKWSRKPVRLAGRRHGWLVRGTLDGVGFDGYIGDRWGRFFIITERELLKAADVSVGEPVAIVVEPTDDPRVFESALLQSKRTTQPKKPRADVRPSPSGSARPAPR